MLSAFICKVHSMEDIQELGAAEDIIMEEYKD